MESELYLIGAVVIGLLIAGVVMSGNAKRKAKERSSIISWHNHLIDQFISVFEDTAEQYNEKIDLAKKYGDKDAEKRLHKLYGDITRTSENIESKVSFLKSTIEGKCFKSTSTDSLFQELKIIESYIAEMANISALIRSLHPVNRNNNSYTYDYEKFISKEPNQTKPWKSSRFFSSCNTKEDLTKKYRELAKIYHPDNAVTGNVESFRQLKTEYDEYSKIA